MTARAVLAVCLLLLASGCRTASSATVATPIPAGYPTEAFRVGAPMVFFGSGGGVPPDLPPCPAAKVIARAATLRTADGVVGVIRLDGPHCSLDVRQGPTALLDAAGTQVDVTLDPVPPAVNPPMSRGNGWGLATGHALWGFAIDGSWCEAAPAFVTIPLSTKAGLTQLKVPLTGPTPTCTGRSDAELRPGVSGNEANGNTPAQAVLSAPQEWSGLRLDLHADSVTAGGDVVGLSATISNPTHSPIPLSPCPSYELVVTEGNGESVAEGTFGCSSPRVLEAGGSVTYPVDGKGFGDGDPDIRAGGPVKVQLAIAGVPTASFALRVS
jgi:hypothetical protein